MYSDVGEKPQIKAGWDLDGFQGNSRGCEHKVEWEDLLDVHQQCGTISSVLQSVLQQEQKRCQKRLKTHQVLS